MRVCFLMISIKRQMLLKLMGNGVLATKQSSNCCCVEKTRFYAHSERAPKTPPFFIPRMWFATTLIESLSSFPVFSLNRGYNFRDVFTPGTEDPESPYKNAAWIRSNSGFWCHPNPLLPVTFSHAAFAELYSEVRAVAWRNRGCSPGGVKQQMKVSMV